MKRNLPKVGAVLLSIILCLCSTVSVFAAPDGENPGTTVWTPFADIINGQGQIIVTTTDVEGAASGALTATAYKFIDVSDDNTGNPAQPLYKWNAEVAKWLESSDTYKNYLVWEDDGETRVATNEVSEEYLALIDAGLDGLPVTEELNAFAGAVSAAIKVGTIDASKLPSVSETLTVSGGEDSATRTGTLDGLSSGSYLVLISGGKLVYRPTMANLTPAWKNAGDIGEGSEAGWYVASPQQLNIKASPVEVEKTVSDPKAAIGDTVTFTIGATVPVYPADATNKKFLIKDTLSKGLLYTAGTVKVYGVIGRGETAAETLFENTADSTFYTFAYSELTDDTEHTGTFTVDLTDTYSRIAGYTSIKVVYDVTITSDAVVGVAGNPNEATIEYSNDPYDDSSYTTKTTETRVYTYGLDLTKVDENDHEIKLAGAEFSVTKEGATAPMQFVKEDGNGKYHVVSAEELTAGVATVTAVITADNGKLDIRGLDVGSYKLRETKAPDGYVLLNGEITFTITDDTISPDKTAGADGIADDDKAVTDRAGYVGETIENHKGFNLPLTGGMGTVMFTVGGLVLIAGAIVLLLVANRKKSSRS